MIHTTVKNIKLDSTQLKQIKKEISKELSRVVANSQISQILRKYGISDPSFLKISFALSLDKLQAGDLAELVDSNELVSCNIENCITGNGSNLISCPVLINGKIGPCPTEEDCLERDGCIKQLNLQQFASE